MNKLRILLLTSLLTSAHAGTKSPVSPAVSPKVTGKVSPSAILATMKKVADWQLAEPFGHPPDDWTCGALYAGVMALNSVADESKYHDALVEAGTRLSWKPGPRVYHADDHCVAQTYLELYLQDLDPAMLIPIQERFDFILAHPKTNDLHFTTDSSADRWSWCDALFMGPPAWVRLYMATGDGRYLEFMDHEWRATSDVLYDAHEHLFFRDSRYFARREANGRKMFWSRGNGWVMAGLARILQYLPADHPSRPFYEERFREMAEQVASLQQSDGLWRSSLLDPSAYQAKETSGSGFFTFALAWGVNHGLLDRARFAPVVRNGWKGLVRCVTAEGKLEHVQPIGADPRYFDPHNSEVFGTGAFLLAGSEVYWLALSGQGHF